METIFHECPFLSLRDYRANERTPGKCRVEKLKGPSYPQILTESLASLGIFRHSAFCRLCRTRHKRHSFATHCLENGIEITVVQRLLGHSTVATTANYLHVRQERLAQIKSPLQLLDLKQLPSNSQS